MKFSIYYSYLFDVWSIYDNDANEIVVLFESTLEAALSRLSRLSNYENYKIKSNEIAGKEMYRLNSVCQFKLDNPELFV